MSGIMKYSYIVVCIVILLLIGCVAKEMPKEQKEIQEEQIEPQKEIEQPEEEPQPEPEAEKQEPIIPETEEEIEQPETEEPELSEEEQLQQIFDYAKTKIKSYSYKYKSATGVQYYIYVKENKIRIGSLSNDNKIYLDTEKKTAEEWCISHTKCGRETGKIVDLDYHDAYIETPLDWLDKITESKKIDKGFYYGKQGWKLDTNLGTVIIDSNFGFIYSIEQEGKTYTFSEAKFNIVKDSDVNVPEYLLPK